MSTLVQRGAVLYSLSQVDHSHRKLHRREREIHRSKQDVRNCNSKVKVLFVQPYGADYVTEVVYTCNVTQIRIQHICL